MGIPILVRRHLLYWDGRLVSGMHRKVSLSVFELSMWGKIMIPMWLPVLSTSVSSLWFWCFGSWWVPATFPQILQNYLSSFQRFNQCSCYFSNLLATKISRALWLHGSYGLDQWERPFNMITHLWLCLRKMSWTTKQTITIFGHCNCNVQFMVIVCWMLCDDFVPSFVWFVTLTKWLLKTVALTHWPLGNVTVNIENISFKLISQNFSLGTCYEIALRWTSLIRTQHWFRFR